MKLVGIIVFVEIRMSILIKGFTLNKQFASYSYNWFYCLDLTTLSWCWDF